MARQFLIKSFYILFVSFALNGCLPVIFTGAAGSAVEFAKDREARQTLTDTRISAGIKADLIKKGFRDLYTHIKVEVVQGRVLLTGSIEKEEDAVKAVEIAWNQKDVVEVINELKIDKNSKRFNLFQYTHDTMITSRIKSKIFMNREIKFVNYTIITINKVVYIFGMARSDEELEKVANIAANIGGVEKVVCHVQINHIVRTNRSEKLPKEKESNGKFIDDDQITVVKPDRIKPAIRKEDDNAIQGTKDDW